MKKRKCKFCQNYTDDWLRVPAGSFCSYDHAVKFANRAMYNKAQKAAKREHKAAKQKLKTKRQYMSEAQSAVNRYIRARDAGKPCISCGAMPEPKRGGTVDAGHYRSRASAPHLRFNLLNISAQCTKCNRFMGGNIVSYRRELIKKIGVDRLERLETDNEPRRFTVEYLQRIKRIFNKRARLWSRD